jgi:hypothetical protein
VNREVHENQGFILIADALVFLRKHLDDHLRIVLGGTQDDPTGDKVVFVDGDQMDPISFKLGAVSALLINVEEERVLRNPDMYVRKTEDGQAQRVQPDIRLILYVLFVARFKQYDAAWQHLSKIIEHIQSVRVFDAQVTPALPANIEKLMLELVTLGFAEQNEVWNALRTTHHPSILYRVKLIAFRDQQVVEPAEITTVEHNLRRIS